MNNFSSNKGGVALFLHYDVKFDFVEKISQVSAELIAVRIVLVSLVDFAEHDFN